ncbi:MAG: NAD(P)-binding protein, partial [Pseudolabrys sp.]
MRSSKSGTVHIIGAGLAGLAAAVRLTQSHRAVTVHEATAYAGGRCRSYHDSASDMLID